MFLTFLTLLILTSPVTIFLAGFAAHLIHEHRSRKASRNRHLIAILALCLLSWTQLPSQEKAKSTAPDTVFALKRSVLDEKIALYEKHIVDLQADFQALNSVLTELKAFRDRVDTLIVAKPKKEKP